jgi:hypothetical protein
MAVLTMKRQAGKAVVYGNQMVIAHHGSLKVVKAANRLPPIINCGQIHWRINRSSRNPRFMRGFFVTGGGFIIFLESKYRSFFHCHVRAIIA